MKITKDKWLKWAAVLFCTVALAFSLILTWQSVSGVGMIGCGVGSGCDSVLGSRWSMLFDVVPVGSLAAGLYIVVLLCVFAASDKELESLCSSLVLVASGAIIGSALWFTALQVFWIHQLCPYCMITHLCGVVASALLFCVYSPKRKWMLWALGLALSGLLAFVQFLTSSPRIQQGWVEEKLPSFSIYEYPHIGSVEAEKVYEILFDYQCSHCHTIHRLMQEVVEKHPETAFVLIPTPLSPLCNPYIPKESDQFDGSCELARLALAMWRISGEAFYSFDSWLFANDEDWRPRNPQDALEYAVSLVGKERLESALSDPWIGESISRASELFGRTNTGKTGAIPRIIQGESWVVPEVETAEELFDVLNGKL